MPIPAEVLAVKRPKNTVVIVYGKEKNLYAVRQRIGCKNVSGRHVPINGPTIGHIIDGVYVPNDDNANPNVFSCPVDLKDWADVELCDSLFNNMLEELKAVYSSEDALKLYCIAVLRVCNPHICDSELEQAYETSFLSEKYPDVALSKNTVSSLLQDVGKAVSRIVRFLRKRAEKVAIDHHLLIDGTLKTDDSRVNSLSEFSRKARLKGTRDISILYAFDLEAMEPVCSKCFLGNMLDATAYGAFIAENKITKGIIVGDKGFPESAAHEQFEANPDLYYLNPIKRNSKLIERHQMLNFTEILPSYEGITCRKEKCKGTNKWLYSFRSSDSAFTEEKAWLDKAKREGSYDYRTMREKQRNFGTIVLECDLDLPTEIVYKAYSRRWEIELVMRFYKSACGFVDTRVHSDYSVIGSEFCDFLSTVLTFRLIQAFDKEKLLDSYTYKKLMSILNRAKKVRTDGENWQLIRINPSQEKVLQSLGLLPKPEEPKKRKRGRPRGSKNKPKDTAATAENEE